MGGVKLSVFILDIILLIVFAGLIVTIFKFHRLFFILELIVLVILILLAFIALFAAYFRANWGWVMTAIIMALVIADLLLITITKQEKTTVFYLTLLAACVGFLISILNIKTKKEEDIEFEEPLEEPVVLKTYSPGKYMGSGKGKTYHISECDWAKKIQAKNIVWFNSKEDAKKKGYKPHNCVK